MSFFMYLLFIRFTTMGILLVFQTNIEYYCTKKYIRFYSSGQFHKIFNTFQIPSRPWNVPSVQVNDVPVSDINAIRQRLLNQRSRFAERVAELRSNSQMGGLFRPRFLHPLYATVNPFDADLDDSQREQIYDSDMITTVTPNHRIQAWDVSDWSVPNIGSRKYYTIIFFL